MRDSHGSRLVGRAAANVLNHAEINSNYMAHLRVTTITYGGRTQIPDP